MLKWLEFKIIVIHKKLRVKLRFYALLSVIGTFAHKVAQTMFILHETLHTILFGIYYCVEVLSVENHIHMLEITCKVAILMVFNCFLALLRIK